MSHACHRFQKCCKTLRFCSLVARCRIPCAFHAKPHLNLQKWSEHVVLLTFWLWNVLRATTACTFSTSQFPKVVRAWCALYMLTWECTSHHNGVHFFDIATSKSAPKLRCFVHFDFEICFAPLRRALFRHLNFQKWSKHGVLCTFWTGNVLRATTACNFSSLIWPHGSAPTAFSEPTFRPLGATNHCKNNVLRLSYLFALLYLFAHLDLLSSDSVSLLFHLSILSEVWLLNFLRQLQLQTLITVHCATLDCTTLHYSTLILYNQSHHRQLQLRLQVQLPLQLHYATLITLQLHYKTPHYTSLQLRYATLH